MLEVHVSERGQAATLSGAILLYGGKNRQSGYGEETSFATVHPVSEVNSRKEIMPGRLLTQKDLATITKSLAKTEATAVNATRWLDSRILATGPDRMIWWTPPHQRAMFFETSEAAKLEIAGSGACPVPGMVWMAMPGNGLFVFAIKDAVGTALPGAILQRLEPWQGLHRQCRAAINREPMGSTGMGEHVLRIALHPSQLHRKRPSHQRR